MLAKIWLAMMSTVLSVELKEKILLELGDEEQVEELNFAQIRSYSRSIYQEALEEIMSESPEENEDVMESESNIFSSLVETFSMFHNPSNHENLLLLEENKKQQNPTQQPKMSMV